MSSLKETIEALQAALEITPDSIPLRKHLAELLVQDSDFGAAEQVYRTALSAAPDDTDIKVGLAEVFYRLEKYSAAFVIVDELVRAGSPPPRALLLLARLFSRSGDREKATEAYQNAVAQDESLVDNGLELILQIKRLLPDPKIPPDDEDMFDTSDDEMEPWDEDFLMPAEDMSGASSTYIEHPELTFEDVGGMEDLKDEIRMKIIHPMNNPELYQAYGKVIGGGILMYGPPGCGKTHLARATAGEVNAFFISVGIHDVLDMWIGNSEKRLHELFELARANTPCVLFFDEVDALGASRTDMRHSGGRHLINQFLSELDGINSPNDGVLVLAATNAPWHLDAAFRRPGRFDRIIFVPPPDTEARASIMKILLKDKPTETSDFSKLAKKTDAFSGADLKAVVELTIEHKLKEAMATGVPHPITMKDLLAAVKPVKPTTKEWFTTARNYALYSNESGLYDDILAYLKLTR